MRVSRMNISARMSHERLADFLNDARFHEPGIKRVPQVMKADVPQLCSLQRFSPCGFDRADVAAAKRENEARGLPSCEKQIEHAAGERYLAALALWSL